MEYIDKVYVQDKPDKAREVWWVSGGYAGSSGVGWKLER
jgi:hypothetical protein